MPLTHIRLHGAEISHSTMGISDISVGRDPIDPRKSVAVMTCFVCDLPGGRLDIWYISLIRPLGL